MNNFTYLSQNHSFDGLWMTIKLLSSKAVVVKCSFNVIILSQLTIFGSQAHCCKLTNPLKALHESGHRYTHTSHIKFTQLPLFGTSSWQNMLFPKHLNFANMVALTCPPVAIFWALGFLLPCGFNWASQFHQNHIVWPSLSRRPERLPSSSKSLCCHYCWSRACQVHWHWLLWKAGASTPVA